MIEQGNDFIMLIDNDKFTELYNVEVWFQERPYKVDSISTQPTPDWLKKDEDIPQSFIELEMKDCGLQSHVEQYLQCNNAKDNVCYIDIIVYLSTSMLKIEDALLVNVSNLSVIALGTQIKKITGGNFEIWTPPKTKLLHLIDNDPTLARFLELLEE